MNLCLRLDRSRESLRLWLSLRQPGGTCAFSNHQNQAHLTFFLPLSRNKLIRNNTYLLKLIFLSKLSNQQVCYKSLTGMTTSAGITGLYTGKPASAVRDRGQRNQQGAMWSQGWQMNTVHRPVGRRRHCYVCDVTHCSCSLLQA